MANEQTTLPRIGACWGCHKEIQYGETYYCARDTRRWHVGCHDPRIAAIVGVMETWKGTVTMHDLARDILRAADAVATPMTMTTTLSPPFRFDPEDFANE
jgi:hypothetical protein